MNRKVYTAGAMILGGLIVGAAVEHLRISANTPEPAEAEPEIIHHVQKAAPAASPGNEDQEKLIASLNARIATLTAELEKSRTPQVEEEEVRVEKREEERDRGDRERRRESWQERMERMKEEDPERYAEMQKRREEFRARMEERKQSKLNFFSSINTKNMTDEQKATHERLVTLNERVSEIGELMMSGQVENRRELHEEMHQAVNEMRELNEIERVYLLEQTANAAGYEGDDAAFFAEHIESIIENTTMRGPGSGRGRGGRGR